MILKQTSLESLRRHLGDMRTTKLVIDGIMYLNPLCAYTIKRGKRDFLTLIAFRGVARNYNSRVRNLFET